MVWLHLCCWSAYEFHTLKLALQIHTKIIAKLFAFQCFIYTPNRRFISQHRLKRAPAVLIFFGFHRILHRMRHKGTSVAERLSNVAITHSTTAHFQRQCDRFVDMSLFPLNFYCTDFIFAVFLDFKRFNYPSLVEFHLHF